MVSNTSGIATKNNFQIDIHDKNILIYLHNTNYNEDVIQTAVDILDYLSNAISNIDPSNFNPLTNEQLVDINQEFQRFLNQKETVINYIRDTNKRVIQQILDIELPSLHKYLASKFASTKTLDLKCNICNNFTGKNNKSLASHKKACVNKKNEHIDSTDSDEHVKIINIKKTIKSKKSNDIIDVDCNKFHDTTNIDHVLDEIPSLNDDIQDENKPIVKKKKHKKEQAIVL